MSKPATSDKRRPLDRFDPPGREKRVRSYEHSPWYSTEERPRYYVIATCKSSKSLAAGAGSVFDFWAAVDGRTNYYEKLDSKALRSDWAAVGNDIWVSHRLLGAWLQTHDALPDDEEQDRLFPVDQFEKHS